MKPFFTFSFSLLILLLASCGPRPEATIDGTVTGASDGAKVYLLDNKQARLDSTTVSGGKFRFAIAKVYPDQYVVEVEGVDRSFPLFVESGAITGQIDPARKYVFAGTPANDRIREIDEVIVKPLTDKMDAVAAELDGAERGTPQYDSLLKLYYAANDTEETAREKAVMENPSSLLAAYLMYRNAHSLTTPAEVDSVLTIIAAAPANAFTDRLKERREVLTKTAVGVQAPDFTQVQVDGTPLSLSSLRGKVVLVDFWASWCGPCRRENPNVVKMYERFKDKGFEILGVSLDDNREDWLQAIADDGLVWKHVSDLKGWQNAVAEQYAVRSIPHTVLVGADGVIVAKNLRGAELEAKVAEILGEN